MSVLGSGAIDWSNPISKIGLNNGLVERWSVIGNKIGGLTWFGLCGRYNGTLTNGPIWDSLNARRSMVFDGSDDYVQTTVSQSFTEMTTSCWAYITTRKAWQGIVFSRGTSVTGIHVDPGATKLGYTWNNDVNTWNWSGGPTLPASEWVFLCVSVSGSSAIAYTWSASNGLLSATNSVSHTSTTVDDLKIGQDETSPTTRGVVGNLDDIRIYNRALTSGEVTELYSDGLSQYPKSLNYIKPFFRGWDPELRTTTTGIIKSKTDAIDWVQPVNQSCTLNRGLLNWWVTWGPKSGGLTLFDLCERSTGTLTNGPTWETTGARRSLKFDGTDDYIQTTVSRSFTEMTISCWVYITTRKAWQGIVFSRGTSVTGIHVDPGATKLGYTWNNDVNTWNWSGGPTLPASEWVFLCVSVSGSSATAYTWSASSGLLSATNSVSHASTTIDDLKIGQDESNPTTRGVVGNLDDVRVYDRALASGEVSLLCYDSRTGYTGTLNRLNKIVNWFDPLVLDLKCQDNNSSKRATDSSRLNLVIATTNTNTNSLSTIGPGGSLRRAFDGTIWSVNEESFPIGMEWSNSIGNRAGFGIALNIQSSYDTIGLLSDAGVSFGVRIENGVLYIVGDDGASGTAIQSIDISSVWTTGWHHLGISFNTDGFATVYWDGVSLGDTQGTAIIYIEFGYFGLDGYSINRCSVPFCDVQIYDRGRSEAQWFTDAQYGDIPVLHLDMSLQEDVSIGNALDASAYGNYGYANNPNINYLTNGPGGIYTYAQDLSEYATNDDALILNFPITLRRWDRWCFEFFAKRGSGGGVAIVGDTALTSYDTVGISIDGNYLVISDEDYPSITFDISSINNSGWYHYAILSGGDDSVDLYVNGYYFTTTNASLFDFTFQALGGDNPVTSSDGKICGFKLYSSNRTAAQILADANLGGLPGITFTSAMIRRPGYRSASARTILRM